MKQLKRIYLKNQEFPETQLSSPDLLDDAIRNTETDKSSLLFRWDPRKDLGFDSWNLVNCVRDCPLNPQPSTCGHDVELAVAETTLSASCGTLSELNPLSHSNNKREREREEKEKGRLISFAISLLPSKKKNKEEEEEEEEDKEKSRLISFAISSSMRKLCPNLDLEDGLETVLEVPIPEEVFFSNGGAASRAAKMVFPNMKAWVRPHAAPPASGGRGAADIQLMLGVIGAPLVPLPIKEYQSAVARNNDDDSIELSMARYIVQQYIAAVGGEPAMSSISSMCAVGKVWMAATDLPKAAGSHNKHGDGGYLHHKKLKKGMMSGGGEMGGFVLWQKTPDLWCLELMVSGHKISAGSDGKVAWKQTPWQHSNASRGPPRPLRRSLQGLDPRLTANLFANSVCLGERSINGEDCFVLKLDAEAAALRSRSSSSVEIIRHTVWGYFSQRTGLLVKLEDSHLLRIRSPTEGNVYWETTMESVVEDYRPVDGVLIAHAGRTSVSMFRFGDQDSADGRQTRTRMEEMWAVEEVDFNVWGLSMDVFLPPADLKKEKQRGGGDVAWKKERPPPTKAQPPATRIGPSQVAAVDIEDSDSTEGEEGR